MAVTGGRTVGADGGGDFRCRADGDHGRARAGRRGQRRQHAGEYRCRTVCPKAGRVLSLLHLPDGLSGAAADELARLPQVREPLELVRHADVFLYGVGRAMELAQRRGLSASERDRLAQEGAVAEALGFYINGAGARGRRRIVAGDSARGHRQEEPAPLRSPRDAPRQEAILAVCAHHPHKLLVATKARHCG